MIVSEMTVNCQRVIAVHYMTQRQCLGWYVHCRSKHIALFCFYSVSSSVVPVWTMCISYSRR